MTIQDFKNAAVAFLKKQWNAFDINKNTFSINVIVLVIINIAAALFFLRADLTCNHSYSLSPVSKQVVSDLEEPLTVKIFFTKDLPAPYNSVYRYLEDMMSEYSAAGNRNFHYEFINVESEESKTLIQSFGVYPVQVREIQSDQFKSRNAYMSLVIVHGDIIQKLDGVTSTEGLEYRITTAIQKMNAKVDALGRLKGHIRMTLYISDGVKTLPISGIDTLEQSVRQIYTRVNNTNLKKIDYVAMDAGDQKNIDMLVSKYGLQRLSWAAGTSPLGARIAAGQGVLGMIIEYDDRFETVQLPVAPTIMGKYVISGLDSLEDRINKALGNILSRNPVVGYITGHGERDLGDSRTGAGTLREAAQGSCEFKPINITQEEIPDDIQTVIINGPKAPYTDAELFKIDQFLMKGRAVIFLIDSFSEIQTQSTGQFGGGQPMYIPLNTGLEKLLACYGVTVSKNFVLDKKCFVATREGMSDMTVYYAPLVDVDGLNRRNAITSGIKKLLVVKASSLVFNDAFLKKENIASTILVSSSKESWLMQGRIDLMPWGMRPPLDKKSFASFPLMAYLNGNFVSYYAENPVPEPDNAKNKPQIAGMIDAHSVIKKSVKRGQIIVAGTSEVSGPQLVDREGRDPNAVLLLNMFDYLRGDSRNAEMRSKGLQFTPVRDTNDTIHALFKIFNMAVLPVLIILAGLLVLRRRASRRRSIEREFAQRGAHHE